MSLRAVFIKSAGVSDLLRLYAGASLSQLLLTSDFQLYVNLDYQWVRKLYINRSPITD